MISSFLYIGQYQEGSTSGMRANALKQLLSPSEFHIINTNIPFAKADRLSRSFGFRYKFGPIVNRINQYVIDNLKAEYFDIIWVDKAIFITPTTTKYLKRRCFKLIHFTPDCAFYQNKSGLFNKSIKHYDFLVTSKSFEIGQYLKFKDEAGLILVSQGFDSTIHSSRIEFENKKDQIVFIGLNEPHREYVIKCLLEEGLIICLAGKNWKKFSIKNRKYENLIYYGSSLINADYSRLISESKLALGLVSKRFPELHTTRTFEIPACGTALVTEKNEETSKFYNEDEVIFFNDINELTYKLKYLLDHPNELKGISDKGQKRVHDGKFDYSSILSNILMRIME
jgi:glycosyltransferase involved in cell wall biosynthesis